MTNCSFCGKDRTQVKHIIAGPNDVFICDECIDLCNDTIYKTSPPSADSSPSFEITEQTLYCAILQNYDDKIIRLMKKWIAENMEESWIRVYDEPDRKTETYKIFFNNESDLVAFKLRWI